LISPGEAMAQREHVQLLRIVSDDVKLTLALRICTKIFLLGGLSTKEGDHAGLPALPERGLATRRSWDDAGD
jgi:hypothetical protein